ncbi:hypothetical protein AK88_00931 [Plasmodium fragile]|uniref:Uncharacterized protein n=1 Tax=Plasmodium fragile TaxID=5857 RepID=A0A0D9QRA6_PLAFR|nr:uncharacterized protein AK88_00931 [Plasmodium fragile]KJP89488.1 hypothetical protein AK88_00931 [Plasmodium fragile]
MKEEESLWLLNAMMQMLNSAKERVTKDHARVRNYVENIKKGVSDLKKLDDIHRSANIFNKVMNSINEIKDTTYIYDRNDADNIYENMIKVANYFLNDNVKIESKEKLNGAALSESESAIVSYIYGKIRDARKIVEMIEEESTGIHDKQIEGERLSTEANHIYRVAKVNNELNNKKDEAKLKLISVLAEIEKTLHKLKSVNKIKCHYDNYNNILEYNEEHEHFKKISSIYEFKKAQIGKEADINEMKTDVNKYQDRLAILDKNGESFKERSLDISAAQMYKTDVEDIINKLNSIGNNINGINSTLDELLKIGNKCQLQQTFLISSSLNYKIANCLINITKQK